jgi:hypothetical protein
MDTCSRLGEPGGAGWNAVNVGRLRTTKAASGRSCRFERPLDRVGGLGLRDSVLRRWVEQRGAGREPMAASRRPTTQAALPSADHAQEVARLQRETEPLRMERGILKKSIAISAGVYLTGRSSSGSIVTGGFF